MESCYVGKALETEVRVTINQVVPIKIVKNNEADFKKGPEVFFRESHVLLQILRFLV